MKILLKVFIGSLIIFVIFIVYMMLELLVGYTKTKLYNPDIQSKWESVDVLQNEVSFGMIISPFFLLFSFLLMAIICVIIIFFYEKLFRNKVR